MDKKPNKIAIIGLPGSGKSTFALLLSQLLDLPVYHLDSYMFEGKQKRDRKVFLEEKKAMLKQNSWIIEGCSMSTLEMRFAEGDMVFYLCFPRLLCLWRICKRYFQYDSLKETGCLKGINWPLIKYIWNFKKNNAAYIEELRKRYPKIEFITFNSSHEIDLYLKKMKKFLAHQRQQIS